MKNKKKKNTIKYDNNTFSFLQSNLKLPLKSIREIFDGFIDDIFDNELLFFKWEIDIVATRKLVSDKERDIYGTTAHIDSNFDSILFSDIKSYLLGIELLEYVYLLKTEKKYYLFFVVKSLLGYNKTLLTHYISILNSNVYSDLLSNSTISYIKNRKKAKEYLYLIISQYQDYNKFTENSFDFNMNFTKNSIGYSYTEYIGNLPDFIDENENYDDRSLFKTNNANGYIGFRRFKFLEEKYNEYKIKYDSELLNLVEYNLYDLNNSFKLISTRNVCEQSIINLWVMYMTLNGFCIKDGKIYETFYSGREARFIGDLNYLKINIDIIIGFLRYFYEQQFANYPIELKVMPYLESAYNRVVSSPYYYLPSMDEDLEHSIFISFINKKLIKSYRDKISDLSYTLLFGE